MEWASNTVANPPKLVVLPPRSQRSLARAPFKTTHLPDGLAWSLHYRRRSGFLIRFPNLADFILDRHAINAICRPTPATTPATIDHLFLNQVVPMAVAHRGHLVLHGSAVNVGGQALAFIGDSGQGKSTLASYFALNGSPFLADDGLVLDLDGSDVSVLAGHDTVRLWADSAAALLSGGARKSDPVQFTSKARFIADETIRHTSQSHRLACIYLLRNEGAASVQIAELSTAPVLISLVNQSFLLDTESRVVLTRHFSQLQTLVKRTRFFAFDYPRDYARLPEVRQAILAHAAGL